MSPEPHIRQHSHNVYCVVCGEEMEIMINLVTELHVYPCGCCGKPKQPQPQPHPASLELDEMERNNGR